MLNSNFSTLKRECVAMIVYLKQKKQKMEACMNLFKIYS